MPAKYLVYGSQSPLFVPGSQNVLERVTETTYIDAGLGDAQTFYYVVRSMDAIGNEDGNLERVEATTPPGPPASVARRLLATAIGQPR